MITFLVILSYASGIVAILHGLAKPASEWVAADRNRGYWLTMMVTGTVVGVGLIATAFYVVGVVPRYASGEENVFRK